jgi:hypothetical protein
MLPSTHIHISLHKAWDLWFHGQDVKADGYIVWGLRLIWWGRIGVIAGFLGGLIIILDIVDEEKLKKYGVRSLANVKERGWSGWVMAIAYLLTILVINISQGWEFWKPHAIGPAAYVATAIFAFVWITMTMAFWTFSKGRQMMYARFFALAMLAISAHCTLLTS